MCWVVPVTWESPSFVVLVLKEIKDSLCLELAWSSGSLWKRRGVTTSPPILLDAVVPLSIAATPGSLASEQGLQILPELLALNRPRSRASFTNQVFIQPGYSQITGHCWYMYSPCWEEKVTHTLPQHAVHSRTHVKPTLPPASWPYRFWCLSPGYRRATPDHLSEAPPSALSWILGNLCWTLINPPSYPPSHPMLELLDQPTNHSHIPPDKKILRPQASLICSHSYFDSRDPRPGGDPEPASPLLHLPVAQSTTSLWRQMKATLHPGIRYPHRKAFHLLRSQVCILWDVVFSPPVYESVSRRKTFLIPFHIFFLTFTSHCWVLWLCWQKSSVSYYNKLYPEQQDIKS